MLLPALLLPIGAPEPSAGGGSVAANFCAVFYGVEFMIRRLADHELPSRCRSGQRISTSAPSWPCRFVLH
jgi:hypothetical protein